MFAGTADSMLCSVACAVHVLDDFQVEQGLRRIGRIGNHLQNCAMEQSTVEIQNRPDVDRGELVLGSVQLTKSPSGETFSPTIAATAKAG